MLDSVLGEIVFGVLVVCVVTYYPLRYLFAAIDKANIAKPLCQCGQEATFVSHYLYIGRYVDLGHRKIGSCAHCNPLTDPFETKKRYGDLVFSEVLTIADKDHLMDTLKTCEVCSVCNNSSLSPRHSKWILITSTGRIIPICDIHHPLEGRHATETNVKFAGERLAEGEIFEQLIRIDGEKET